MQDPKYLSHKEKTMHNKELNETIYQELAVSRLGNSQFSQVSSDGSLSRREN